MVSDQFVDEFLMVREECKLNDSPYFVDHNHFGHGLKAQQLKNSVFRSVLENANYRWSMTHCTPDATKTDAPWEFICDVFRECLLKKGVDAESADNALAKKLLSDAPMTTKTINFSLTKRARNGNKLKLYKNPPPNWGPMAAAKKGGGTGRGHGGYGHEDEADTLYLEHHGDDGGDADEVMVFTHKRLFEMQSCSHSCVH